MDGKQKHSVKGVLGLKKNTKNYTEGREKIGGGSSEGVMTDLPSHEKLQRRGSWARR